MFFELHSDFQQFLPADWERFDVHLTNLLEAHRHGRHFFFAERGILNVLEECDFLGRVQIQTVRDIKGKYIEFDALRRRLPRTTTLFDSTRLHVASTQSTWALSIAEVLRPPTLASFHLLVENLANDGLFWDITFAAIASLDGVKIPSPRLNPVHCGGRSMDEVIAELSDEGPFYCIVDSDRRSPFDSIGATERHAENMLIQLNYIATGETGLSRSAPWSGFSILPCREAENLVPLNILLDILSELQSPNYDFVRQIVPSQPHLNDASDREIWAFYDIKRVCDVTTLVYKSDAEEEYFDRIVARVGSTLPRIRDGLLADFGRYCTTRQVSQRRRRIASELRRSPFYSIFQELFEHVYCLACSPQARFT
jgi:hypothetical protein